MLRSIASRSVAVRGNARHMSVAASKKPMKVAITGAAGNIGYAMVPRVASGQLLGLDQPVHLSLVEVPQGLKPLGGVEMELDDCAFPLLKKVTCTADPLEGFADADVVLLVGAKPRGPGMERADLMKDNAKIFVEQGKALNQVAKKTCKVVVVGNPANTNCLIAATYAPNLDPRNFSAMTRLDHNRGLGQLAKKCNVGVDQISKFAIWGNHSPTMYPDISHCLIDGKPAKSLVDEKWLKEVFMPCVQKRGAAIIAARGASSAASAASAAIDHMRDWVLGTNGAWTSMAVYSEGKYNTPKGVYYSYPLTTANGSYSVVEGLSVDAFSAECMAKTGKELLEERDLVKDFLK
eukprot:tig00021441_g21549.t1